MVYTQGNSHTRKLFLFTRRLSVHLNQLECIFNDENVLAYCVVMYNAKVYTHLNSKTIHGM